MEIREPEAVYGETKVSEATYLAWERETFKKHEYFNGEVFAISAGGRNHNVILSNVFGELCSQLSGSPYRCYGSDMRLYIPENTLYTYPDIAVYAKPVKLAANDPDTSTYPVVIIEIIAESTAAYDRGQKFDLYKDIPGLREYVLIESRSFCVDIFRKQKDSTWLAEQYSNINSVVKIAAVNFRIWLKEIYIDASF